MGQKTNAVFTFFEKKTKMYINQQKEGRKGGRERGRKEGRKGGRREGKGREEVKVKKSAWNKSSEKGEDIL
jgi:predicted transposase YdaD